MSDYAQWFEKVTGFAPHPWQQRLGDDQDPTDRLLRIPTGLGKSAGTVLPWLHAMKRADARWPRRLVFVLPMRVLADQMAREASEWLRAAGLADRIAVHVLMGGVEALRWVEDLEKPAILIGTQDMLLSRALNRGYGSGRGLWPMEFGALHNDALWVFDEVQLMGVALATSTQLHAFRRASQSSMRPTYTWWMSATLQPEWLDSIDFRVARRAHLAAATTVPESERQGGAWDNKKALRWRQEVGTEDEVADLVLLEHRPSQQTLVVVNTVRRATEIRKALEKKLKKAKGDTPALELVHSRFRPHERATWQFLGKDAERDLPAGGRIIVATQVVEAGVDISSSTMITDLAPYPSLVQRFGRAARRSGESAAIIVVGEVPTDEKKSAPYTLTELEASGKVLSRLTEDGRGVSVCDLEEAEAGWNAAFVREVYPYTPEHLLRHGELEDLFDTSPDLAGSDLDVGRYIRVGEDRDVRIFYRTLEQTPRMIAGLSSPRRDELCAAPLRDFEEWRKKGDKTAYVFDYELGGWRRLERAIPGMTILLPSSAGGYDLRFGWDPNSKSPVEPVPSKPSEGSFESKLAEASESADNETLSEADWKTIAFHGGEVAEEASALGKSLGVAPDLVAMLELAGRWHDAGKNHEVFANAVPLERRPAEHPIATRRDLAKAPRDAWRRPPYPSRPGFRHELASTLALFELLKRAQPDHPAVEGFAWPGEERDGTQAESLGPLAAELAALSAEQFDLVAYLVCSHHGKVRTTWASMPRDQESESELVFGLKEGDSLPALELRTSTGSAATVPELRLSLEAGAIGLGPRYGRSWTDRTAALRAEHGPFTLAFLEALFRVADWRASKRTTQETR